MAMLALVLTLRGYLRLAVAGLYAEDGALFLMEAIRYGDASLIIPYAGYFHTIPRIIAFCVSFLPAILIPHTIVLICFIFAFLVYSTLLSTDYSYLIPDIRIRGILVIILALSPGTDEVIGNLANLHWLCLLWLGFRGIADLSVPYRFWILIPVFLCIATEGATIVLLPLYGTRILLHILRKDGNRPIIFNTIVFILILVFAYINYTIRIEETKPIYDIALLAKVYFKTFISDILVHAWASYLVYVIPSWYWSMLAIPAVVAIVWLFNRSLRLEHILIFVFVGSFSLIPLMIAMARARSIPYLIDATYFGWGTLRYALLLPIAGYMLWFSALSARYVNHPLVVFSFASVMLSVALFNLFFHSRTLITNGTAHNHWIEQANQIDNLKNFGKPESLDIEIHPAEWYMHLQAPKGSWRTDKTVLGLSKIGSSIAIQVNAGNNVGKNVDWWLLATTSDGRWFSYIHPDKWMYIGFNLDHVTPSYQGPLVNIKEVTLFDTTAIPSGCNVLHFWVDTNKNGILDYDQYFTSSYALVGQ